MTPDALAHSAEPPPTKTALLDRLGLFRGLRPFSFRSLPTEVLAGLALAALAIPEVMGYTSIARMPLVTGLYTILLPLAAFSIFGSSRHLVVGGDSATSAIMAAGLVELARADSTRYIALSGVLALTIGVMLLVARLVRLGFLANFLSRSMLVGFLGGIGVRVICDQVAPLLGVRPADGLRLFGHTFDNALTKAAATASHVGDAKGATIAISLVTLATLIAIRLWARRVPGELLVVVVGIFVSWKWNLVGHGVSTLGHVPSGLPHLGLPTDVGLRDVTLMLGTAIAAFIIVVAESAATAQAFAAKHNERYDLDSDFVGLGLANIFAGLSGSFLVAGSASKTEMVDGAGGRSQVAQLTTVGVVLAVLLFLTGPLQYLPHAVLAAIVVMIGVRLVNFGQLRLLYRVRRDEFAIAMLTLGAFVLFGIEVGIVIAIGASIIGHLRRSYRIETAIQIPNPEGEGLLEVPVAGDVRTAPGLVMYRFAYDLFFANSNRLLDDMSVLMSSTAPLSTVCINASAIPDIDFTGSRIVLQVQQLLADHNVALEFARVRPTVKAEFDRYGITDLLGPEAFHRTATSAIESITQRQRQAMDEPNQ